MSNGKVNIAFQIDPDEKTQPASPSMKNGLVEWLPLIEGETCVFALSTCEYSFVLTTASKLKELLDTHDR